MGLLDTLLSLIGRDGSSADDDRRDATVSVEREAHADTETAVGGTGDDAAAAAAGTDAAASTESLVDEADAADDAAEPAEAAGEADTPETELDTATAESAGETTGEHEAAGSDAVEAGAGTESVKTIKGIGPAYAERLSNEGVDSVADLAAADAAELAAAVDLSEKRVGGWIERARDR
jgi:predicted flap endonuclease-1-like 5' DNA nuclease